MYICTRDATEQALGEPGQAEPTAAQTETERAEPASAIDILVFFATLYMYDYISYMLLHV